MYNAFVSENIPLSKLENLKLKYFVKKTMQKQIFVNLEEELYFNQIFSQTYADILGNE